MSLLAWTQFAPELGDFWQQMFVVCGLSPLSIFTHTAWCYLGSGIGGNTQFTVADKIARRFDGLCRHMGAFSVIPCLGTILIIEKVLLRYGAKIFKVTVSMN